MTQVGAFNAFSPTLLADLLTRAQVMDGGVRPLWPDMPRVAGLAFTVRCLPGENLMLHAAIYRAAPGSILVVEGGDSQYAVAGANVCAVAQKRGVAALVVDGVIRDLAETRARGFPVFARGVMPIPGAKEALGALGGPVLCGGVTVWPGDVIVADEEGIVVVPKGQAAQVWHQAQARAHKESLETLEQWEVQHRARIEALLKEKGFRDE